MGGSDASPLRLHARRRRSFRPAFHTGLCLGPELARPKRSWLGWQPVGPLEFGIAHDRGYQEGVREGERDARQRRTYDIRRHDAYNDGDRGYNRNEGDRGRYRDDFRRGFESGYRDGFDRVRGVSTNRRTRAAGRLPAAGVEATASPHTPAAMPRASTRDTTTTTTATATTRWAIASIATATAATRTTMGPASSTSRTTGRGSGKATRAGIAAETATSGASARA